MRLFDSGFKTIQPIHQVHRHQAQSLYLALGRDSESSSGTLNELGQAKRSAQMTAAFGVHDLFEEVLRK